MIKKIIFILFFLCVTNATYASCSFTRDLDMGDEGEDVKCLQEYLNKSGYTLASKGVGSVGRETKTFKDLTKEAVKKWQKDNNIIPANGYFGPLSRKKYSSQQTKTQAISSEKIQKIAGGASYDARILNTLKNLEQVEVEVQDADESSKAKKAEAFLVDARSSLIKVFGAYINNDTKAVDLYLTEVVSNTQSALDQLDSTTQKIKVSSRLNELQKKFNKLKALVDNARTNGDSVGEVEDLTDEIADLIRNARSGSSTKAENILDQVEAKINQGKSLLSSSHDSKADAADAIDVAKKSISSSNSSITKAQKNNKGIGDALSLLDSAKSLLDKARIYYDDEVYTSAQSYAQKAGQKAKDALQEIN